MSVEKTAQILKAAERPTFRANITSTCGLNAKQFQQYITLLLDHGPSQRLPRHRP